MSSTWSIIFGAEAEHTIAVEEMLFQFNRIIFCEDGTLSGGIGLANSLFGVSRMARKNRKQCCSIILFSFLIRNG